jgi:plasmid stabilization system protein ParE
MARLEWSERARTQVEQLVLSHSLLSDTGARIEASAQPLARFPRFGPEIKGVAEGGELRFLIGPWPWLVIVYLYLASEERVVIVSVEDGRGASATISGLAEGD